MTKLTRASFCCCMYVQIYELRTHFQTTTYNGNTGTDSDKLKAEICTTPLKYLIGILKEIIFVSYVSFR